MGRKAKILTGDNIKYPTQTRLHLTASEITNKWLNQSYIRPDLNELSIINNAQLILFYNIHFYHPKVNAGRTEELHKKNEKDILRAYEEEVSVNVIRRIMKNVREGYAKIIALMQACGLGLELKAGQTNVDKNLKECLMR